ncbi:MAG: RNA polymerase sigma factor [Ignavibacteriae bacterium]|nr:MAG: RNA polymerase sigma factor [Ignavibacteriota bacterium]
MSTHDPFLDAFHSVQRDVERFALFLERDRDRAKDLVCDAVYSALRVWKQIGTADALRAYCITAVLRAHRNGKRREERFVRGCLDDLVAPSNLSPEEATDVQLVRDAIAQLPDIERIALVLAEIEGWPLNDIATELGIGLSAVKMRIKRGRDRLRTVMQEVDHE